MEGAQGGWKNPGGWIKRLWGFSVQAPYIYAYGMD